MMRQCAKWIERDLLRSSNVFISFHIYSFRSRFIYFRNEEDSGRASLVRGLMSLQPVT